MNAITTGTTVKVAICGIIIDAYILAVRDGIVTISYHRDGELRTAIVSHHAIV